MKLVGVMVAALAAGCGSIIRTPAWVIPPPGATINGVAGPVEVSEGRNHIIEYADGHVCTLESRTSAGVVFSDVVLWFPFALLIDVLADTHTLLEETSCPGVVVH